MRWTHDQQQAIDAPRPGALPSQTLLVAAAAGSGKTAVLVERIIQRLQDETRPMAINELLVLTFTKAAANEMKSRIGMKLMEVFEETQNPYIEEQLRLLPSAQISTLHSFCQWVLRNYFYELEMDPGSRIGNEGQMTLLKSDVLDALLASAYEDGLYHIEMLADTFGQRGEDTVLKKLILDLYEFSRAMENPRRWLEQVLPTPGDLGGELVPGQDPPAMETTKWGAYFWQQHCDSLAEVQATLSEVQALMEGPQGPRKLEKVFAEVQATVTALGAATTWDEATLGIRSIQFNTKMPAKLAKADSDQNEGLFRRGKELLAQAREQLKAMQTSPLRVGGADWYGQLAAQADVIRGIVELTIAFGEAFQNAKRSEGLLDFNDLEHYCLELLTEGYDEAGRRLPSKVALELRTMFQEVMIDEYQDTNGVQEAIVRLVSRGDNSFYVGDVKQSIYGFRMADPSLFLEKYYRFGRALEDVERRIDLAQNFRSHENVLAATNFICSQIMTGEATGLAYGEAEALYPGREVVDPPADYVGGEVDLWLVEDEAGEESSSDIASQAYEREICLIAAEMRRLYDSQAKVQDRDGNYRPIRWSDMVVLSRATSSFGNAFVEIMRRFEIPAYAESRNGYFQSPEVRLLMNLLQIIDNPEQDLPMAVVLRSVFCMPLLDKERIAVQGLNRTQLAQIRLHGKQYLPAGSTLWQAMQHYIAMPTGAWTDDMEVQVRRFVERIEAWRTYSRRHSVSELLWKIYDDTDYLTFVSGRGEVCRANVQALYDRAKDYEAGSFRGLFRFLRFLEDLRDSGEDLALATTVGEGDDVVRLMTIHKSKGLEFPVVFLMRTGSKFNLMDLNTPVLFHKEAGLGLEGFFAEYRVRYPSLTWLYVRDRMCRDSKAEEQRVLYVALTRAKDKLYIVGSVTGKWREKTLWQGAAATATPTFSAGQIHEAMSYLDWIVMACLRHLHGGALRNEMDVAELYTGGLAYGDSRWHIQHVYMPDSITEQDVYISPRDANFDRSTKRGYIRDLSNELVNEETVDSDREERSSFSGPIDSLTHRLDIRNMEQLRMESRESDAALLATYDTLRARMEWVYPHVAATRTPAKTSVTELKRRHEAIDIEATPLLRQDTEPKEVPFALETSLLPEEALASLASTDLEGQEATHSLDTTVELRGVFARQPRWKTEAMEVPTTGTAFGTAMHSAMEWLPIQRYTLSQMHAALDTLVSEGRLTAEERESISAKKLCGFFESDIAERLAQASVIRRELSFSILLPGTELDAQLAPEERVFLQGIMDLVFRDEAGWVLVDYKTDSRIRAEALCERYRLQLSLYANALARLTGEPVSEVYIYSFALGKALRVAI